MKRVIYRGKASSYRTNNCIFTKDKNFNDVSDEDAKSYETNTDFLVIDSPKAQIELNSEEVNIPLTNDEEESEKVTEEQEKGSEENKKIKKLKNVKK